MSSVRIILLVAMITLLFQRCDTALNVERPSQKNFTRFYEGVNDQFGVDMVVGPDYSTYILGNTERSSDTQLYLAKVDMEGNVVWQRMLGGATDEEARDIEWTSNGRLAIVANFETPSSTNRDVAIYVVNPDDPTDIDSTKYGYPLHDDDARSISEVFDGFIVSGTTTNVFTVPGPAQPNNTSDGFAFRFNADLSVYSNTWEQRTYSVTDPDVVVKMIEYNGEFYGFGYTTAFGNDAVSDQNIWVFKLTQAGGAPGNNLVLTNTLIPGAQSANNNERLTSATIIPGGFGFVLTGYTSDPATGRQQMLVVKLKNELNKTMDATLANEPRVFGADPSATSMAPASAFALQSGGFLVVGSETASTGDENILFTKLSNDLGNAWVPPYDKFFIGGIGEDLPAAVAETHDNRILILGTMTLGGVNGQKKIALMKVSPRGMFGE